MKECKQEYEKLAAAVNNTTVFRETCSSVKEAGVKAMAALDMVSWSAPNHCLCQMKREN